MSVTDEVSVKQKIWDFREHSSHLLREATKALAEKTHTLAISTTNEGDVYYSGASNLLDMAEFYDIIMTKQILMILDQFDFWHDLFGRSSEEAPYHVIFGEDLKQAYLANCGMVYSYISTPKLQCAIGVVGPARLRFASVIPIVAYMGHLLEEVANS